MKRVHVTVGLDLTLDGCDLPYEAVKDTLLWEVRRFLCADDTERDSVTVTVERLDP